MEPHFRHPRLEQNVGLDPEQKVDFDPDQNTYFRKGQLSYKFGNGLWPCNCWLSCCRFRCQFNLGPD